MYDINTEKQSLLILDKIEKFELQNIFTDEDDNNVIFSIQPGAGGVESQDFSAILLHMYKRWFDRLEFSYNILELQIEDVGIKGVTIEVHGKHAYGYLKSEDGVHRIQRISPYSPTHKRHTSFASVSVTPIHEKTKFIIDAKDIETETLRSGGKGGQNVNKVETCVRMTHIPTRISVRCENERSQLANKKNALRILTAKVENHFINKDSIVLDRQKIEFSNQMRTYTLDSNQMIKDERTGYKEYNVDDVLNGNLSSLVHSYLLHK